MHLFTERALLLLLKTVLLVLLLTAVVVLLLLKQFCLLLFFGVKHLSSSFYGALLAVKDFPAMTS